MSKYMMNFLSSAYVVSPGPRSRNSVFHSFIRSFVHSFMLSFRIQFSRPRTFKNILEQQLPVSLVTSPGFTQQSWTVQLNTEHTAVL